MNLRIENSCKNINWQEVSNTLRIVGMGSYSPSIHRKAFENSQSTVFVFENDTLVGFGRALSDGAYQTAIYDVAIIPEYQGKGIGRLIIEKLISYSPQCNFILFASVGKEDFYYKLNFRKMKTGMALFKDQQKMFEKGFID